MLGDMGNKWAVRILLECILVTGHNEVVAKVMFLQVCVCPQGGGCLPQCMLGYQTPLGPGRPPSPHQAAPRTRQTPQTRHTPPGPGRPPREADCSIRSMSGWYASYWNAFLLILCVKKCVMFALEFD